MKSGREAPKEEEKERAVVFSSPHGLPKAIRFVRGCQAVKRA